MKASVLKEELGLVPEGYNLSNVLISVIYARKELRFYMKPISDQGREEKTL